MVAMAVFRASFSPILYAWVLFARMTASLRTLKMGVILGSLWEARFGHRLEGPILGCLRIQFWKPMPGASIGDSPDTESADRSCQRYMMDSTKKGMEYLNSVSVQFETPSIGLGIHVRKFKPGRWLARE